MKEQVFSIIGQISRNNTYKQVMLVLNYKLCYLCKETPELLTTVAVIYETSRLSYLCNNRVIANS